MVPVGLCDLCLWGMLFSDRTEGSALGNAAGSLVISQRNPFTCGQLQRPKEGRGRREAEEAKWSLPRLPACGIGVQNFGNKNRFSRKGEINKSPQRWRGAAHRYLACVAAHSNESIRTGAAQPQLDLRGRNFWKLQLSRFNLFFFFFHVGALRVCSLRNYSSRSSLGSFQGGLGSGVTFIFCMREWKMET